MYFVNNLILENTVETAQKLANHRISTMLRIVIHSTHTTIYHLINIRYTSGGNIVALSITDGSRKIFFFSVILLHLNHQLSAKILTRVLHKIAQLA